MSGCFNEYSIYESTLDYIKHSGEDNGFTQNFSPSFFQSFYDYTNAERRYFTDSISITAGTTENNLPWNNNIPSTSQIHLTNIVKAVGDEAADFEAGFENDSALEEGLENLSLEIFASKINTRIDHVIDDINNDLSLTDDERINLLNAANITKLLMFNTIVTCANSADCIPDSGFEKRGWLKKTFRKVVNAVVTIVWRVAVNTPLCVAPGAVIGMAVGNPAAGAVAGAAFGEFVGLVVGIGDVMNGNVICALPWR